RRFQDAVTSGDDDRARDLIASGDLGIYARMYAARLADVLADDYPKLRAALGDDRFDAIVRTYLRVHPPRSFTLRDAGAALPELLASDDAGTPPWAADLARLERARVEVFDGPDAAALTREAIAADELPALMLRWIPSSVVISIAWNVDDLWSAIEDGAAAPRP